MECKVNGKTVIEFKDDRLKPGGFGLVKFRSPSAEFRNFRFGPELTDSTIPRRLTTKVNKLVENIDSVPHHHMINSMNNSLKTGHEYQISFVLGLGA